MPSSHHYLSINRHASLAGNSAAVESKRIKFKPSHIQMHWRTPPTSLRNTHFRQETHMTHWKSRYGILRLVEVKRIAVNRIFATYWHRVAKCGGQFRLINPMLPFLHTPNFHFYAFVASMQDKQVEKYVSICVLLVKQAGISGQKAFASNMCTAHLGLPQRVRVAISREDQ